MAAKPATAPATPEKGATNGAVQIAQMVSTLSTNVGETNKNLAALDARVAKIEDMFKNLGLTLTSMESKLDQLSVGISAAASGTKRAPKAPVTGGSDAPASTAAASTPAGEKFPSSANIWLGRKFKENSEKAKSDYFTKEQLETINKKLSESKEYTDINPDTGKTDAEKARLRQSKLAKEFKVIWDYVRNDSALNDKFKAEWTREKSEFENKSRTPAKKEDV